MSSETWELQGLLQGMVGLNLENNSSSSYVEATSGSWKAFALAERVLTWGLVGQEPTSMVPPCWALRLVLGTKMPKTGHLMTGLVTHGTHSVFHQRVSNGSHCIICDTRPKMVRSLTRHTRTASKSSSLGSVFLSGAPLVWSSIHKLEHTEMEN